MKTIKEPVSVVRIPRRFVNQIEPSEREILPNEDAPTYETEQPKQETRNTKSDIFVVDMPRTSEPKTNHVTMYDDFDTQYEQRYSIVQRQPTQLKSWFQRLPENATRPHLNWEAKGNWSFGLCSLCDDFNMFCYACSCWCCFRHELSSMMGEHWFLWFVNCSPLMELRTKFRQHYGIQGSIAEDFCLGSCCPLCVALQMANEARNYGHRIFS